MRGALDQSSTVEVPSSGTRLDSGVKILSYFQILVKPQLGATTAAVREMFHLATMMDLLRKGHLSQVGDSMAARFFALHQSILDGGWEQNIWRFTVWRRPQLLPQQFFYRPESMQRWP